MTPILKTPRLILRQFTPDDWPAIDAMVSDPEATRFMHFAHWDEDRRRQWFDRCVAGTDASADTGICWAIARKATGLIGWFFIGNTDPPAVPGERGFGYLLDRACWGQGYMTEALRAVLDYEFQVRSTPQVRAECEIGNGASARVMEKVGMRREKTVCDADFEGNWAFRHHYVITRAEYRTAR